MEPDVFLYDGWGLEAKAKAKAEAKAVDDLLFIDLPFTI